MTERETQIEIKVTKDHKKQLRLEGSLRPNKGHGVFKRHKVTGEVTECELTFKSFSFNHYLLTGNALLQGKIHDNGNYTYGCYLNLENAKKKLL